MTDIVLAEIRRESVAKMGCPMLTLLETRDGTWWRVETRRGRKMDVPTGQKKPTYVTQAYRGIATGSVIAWEYPTVRRDTSRIDSARNAHDGLVGRIQATGRCG